MNNRWYLIYLIAINDVDTNEKNKPIKNNKTIRENINLSTFFHQL